MLKSSQNIPYLHPVCGKIVFHETGPWPLKTAAVEDISNGAQNIQVADFTSPAIQTSQMTWIEVTVEEVDGALGKQYLGITSSLSYQVGKQNKEDAKSYLTFSCSKPQSYLNAKQPR